MQNNANDGSYWWKSKTSSDLFENVFQYIHHLDTEQSYRSNDNLRNARLYGNYEMLGLNAHGYNQSKTGNSLRNRVTLNVVQSMVDTVVSKMTKNKPRPLFLTEGGNWELKQRSKKLTKFIDGTFSSTQFYEEGEKAFKDSAIFGTGAVKVFAQDGNIKSERVFIEELILDDVEAYYGKPRQMHQVKHIHKEVLVAMFPNQEVMIEQANNDDSKYSTSYVKQAKNLIRVVESWHLPSGKDAKDGRHAIVISNAKLLDEDYTKDYFPFVFFRWNTRPVGFFGQGISEQLAGIQLEINKLLRTIQVAMHLVSVPKIFLEASSKIVSAHINNKIGGIIKFAGSPPTFGNMGNISPDLFTQVDRLYARSFEIVGISQLSAESKKPTGLDSGKALREFNDIESERFLSVGKSYEKAYMDAAKIMIDMARDLYKDNKDLEVQVKGRKFIETIKWSEVDIENEKFVMDVFPTSALSRTPAGRLQDIQDLIDIGFIGKEEGMKLLDFPDLEGSMNMLNADSNNLDKIIDSMMEKGEYISPEPYQNLENGVRKMQQAYLMFKNENAPDDRLELLRQWMEDANGLILKSQQPSPDEIAAQQAEQLQIEQANLAEQELPIAPAPQEENANIPADQLEPELAPEIAI
jgi:hypothetical protein